MKFLKSKVNLLTITALASLVSLNTLANKSTDTASDQAIANYINNHPEVVYNALVKYQQQMQQNQQKEAINHLKKNFNASFLNSNDGSVGNKQGNVHILVFSDRQCGYCKKAWKTMNEMAQKHKNLHVSYKEVPILGPGSAAAAKVAVWAQQNKMFDKVDDVLAGMASPVNKDTLKQALSAKGISDHQVEEALNSSSIESVIQENMSLAGKVGLQGTPMLFIANKDGSDIRQIANFMDAQALSNTIESMSK